ncbi:MAG: phage N-6-adenine-methyltransferase [Muribaculaceae bacterium]|nr:phage N-6-adenine-methyltransferase [Muribaculaceae bacterium]
MTAGRKVNTLSQSWCTPPKYIGAIKSFWDGEIELDPCSNEYSMVGANTEFMLPETDGLMTEWNYRTIYVNPPYGADRSRGTTIKNWLAKCAYTHERYNSEIIALIPVATNTSHWKEYIFGVADALCFLADTRLRFYVDGIEHEKGAPMACCLVYWGNEINKFVKHFMKYGAAIDISGLKNKNTQSLQLEGLPLFNI